MSLTNLQRYWRHAAQKHALSVKTPFVLQLGDGSSVTAEVLLEGYGARCGMLIVSDYGTIKAKTASILQAGYGYSCIAQPSDAEITSLGELDSVLEDWGFADSGKDKA